MNEIRKRVLECGIFKIDEDGKPVGVYRLANPEPEDNGFRELSEYLISREIDLEGFVERLTFIAENDEQFCIPVDKKQLRSEPNRFSDTIETSLKNFESDYADLMREFKQKFVNLMAKDNIDEDEAGILWEKMFKFPPDKVPKFLYMAVRKRNEELIFPDGRWKKNKKDQCVRQPLLIGFSESEALRRIEPVFKEYLNAGIEESFSYAAHFVVVAGLNLVTSPTPKKAYNALKDQKTRLNRCPHR